MSSRNGFNLTTLGKHPPFRLLYAVDDFAVISRLRILRADPDDIALTDQAVRRLIEKIGFSVDAVTVPLAAPAVHLIRPPAVDSP